MDDLDKHIKERAKRNPNFYNMIKKRIRRRRRRSFYNKIKKVYIRFIKAIFN